ncbi:RmlC-like cupin [Glarea lozoyensis ATCC 20868]|uniref:RmlC-like cupin n=1 Tax=Glarea lozoyensis (strain ATCC 20868 / MF5171) TaxID=1116229 RepID=S3D6J9_GLAL2|nr:RmlC-like cupin [Glarea lozoyensis ATCC 20868]EPE34122.1 RmlC-like cupin [Glarea lozoyensis ATCC 20868]
MQYTSTFAIAFLASTASAAPYNQAPGAATTLTTITTPAATPPATAPGGLTLTQQLFLADTAVDRFALLGNEAFVFDFNDPEKKQKGKGGRGGDLVVANRKTHPALVGTGSGMAVGFLGPCGFNTPHVHPRATELQIVTKGKLTVEMVPENGVFNVPGDKTSKRRVIHADVGENQMFPFYQGSVHTQFNPTCETATFIASFNAEDFGAGQVVDEVLAFQDDIVLSAFGESFDASQLAAMRKKLPASIAQGVASCIATCGGLEKIGSANGS